MLNIIFLPPKYMYIKHRLPVYSCYFIKKCTPMEAAPLACMHALYVGTYTTYEVLLIMLMHVIVMHGH